MTRAHIEIPAWSWRCDECGREDFTIARTSSQLPTPDEMREAGWFVAKLWGDKCPSCVLTGKEKNDDEGE